LAPAGGQQRGFRATLETVLPALSYGGGCWSAVELQNLGESPVTVELEAHRDSGGLVPLVDRRGMAVRLDAGESGRYRLQIPEETAGAWVKVREPISSLDRAGGPGGTRRGPVIAVSAATECLAGGQLIATVREAAYPMRNPWLAGDVSEIRGGIVSLTNTSGQAATASLCYGSGNLFSMPDGAQRCTGCQGLGSELRPICSAAFDVQIPPFAARQFPVERHGNRHFALRVRGSAIVLQMLKPLKTGVKVYTVDSTVRFGGEVSGPAARP
jgi:hypothetical protein